MKHSRILSILIILSLLLSVFTVPAAAADIITDPTGYTRAEDVNYITREGYVVNWGARGEDCVFLSKYAVAYYTGSYTFEKLSQNSGGSTQSNAPYSALYSALAAMMKSKHSHITNYGETRYIYRYTDCLKNDYDHISSFYSGIQLSGNWDSGNTWNREHTWPNSKGLGGSDENDIMMLRPTSVKENSSRGNTAYGQSGGYYDPGVAVRGDCARIVLYTYVRWGNTGKMWGTGGVMENMETLLRWMEEDPVDTWEMGRNDAVQSITGVRNVFVDYPEFAFLLFGRDVPENMSTPSDAEVTNPGGSTGTTPTTPSTPSTTPTTPTTPSTTPTTPSTKPSTPPATQPCTHQNVTLQNVKEASCTEDGYDGDMVCDKCGKVMETGQTVTAKGHNFGDWQVIKPATVDETGAEERHCTTCLHSEEREIPKLDPANTEPAPTIPNITLPPATQPAQTPDNDTQTVQVETWVWIVGAAAVLVCVAVVTVVVIKKRSKKV